MLAQKTISHGRAATYGLGTAVLTIGLLCTTALGGKAWGQQVAPPQPAAGEPQASRGISTEQIVVTAEKRSATVQSAPLSITALSGAQLEAQGVAGVTGIAQETPGISMRTAGPGQTELEMRGMSSSGGSSPTVGFYLDETPLTPPAASLNGKVVIDPDLFDLNRVEVLRGPQGTLYGSGSMGGTIKMLTNRPDLDQFSGEVDVTLSGTEGGGANPSGKFEVNIPLVDDEVALRLVGTTKYVNGWIDRIVAEPFPVPTNPGAACPGWPGCNRGDVTATSSQQTIPNVNWELEQSGRVSLLIKPSQALSIDSTIMFQGTTMGGYNDYDSVPGSGTLAHYQPFNTAEPFSDTFQLYSTTVSYDLGFAQLTSATSYWYRDERQTQDASEAIYSLLNYFGLPDTAYAPATFTEQDISNQLSEEIRLSSSGDGPFQWLGGAFYSRLESIYHDTNEASELADLSVGGAAANPRGIIYDSHNPYHVDQYAVFGEASYKLTDELKLTAGLRYFDYSTHVDEEQSGIGTFTGNATQTIAAFDTSASGFTPKLNLSYQPSQDLTIYATAAKGFRPGGVNLPIPAGIGCNLTQEVYGPDTSWDYELGEKAKLLDNRLVVNADFYFIEWSNVQQLINQPCGYPLTQNAGSAESYGPELEITAHLTPEITLTASGAYTHATLTSVNPALTRASPTLVSGTPILNVPTYTESTALTYTTPLSERYDFVARVTNAYVGPSTDISYGYVNLPAYDLVGLRGGVVGDSWSANLFIDNLTNKHAALSVNTTAFDWIIPSLTRVATNQPMTIGLDVNYRF